MKCHVILELGSRYQTLPRDPLCNTERQKPCTDSKQLGFSEFSGHPCLLQIFYPIDRTEIYLYIHLHPVCMLSLTGELCPDCTRSDEAWGWSHFKSFCLKCSLHLINYRLNIVGAQFWGQQKRKILFTSWLTNMPTFWAWNLFCQLFCSSVSMSRNNS